MVSLSIEVGHVDNRDSRVNNSCSYRVESVIIVEGSTFVGSNPDIRLFTLDDGEGDCARDRVVGCGREGS